MLTLAAALSIADGMGPDESLEIDGDNMRADLWWNGPNGERSLMTTFQLEPPPRAIYFQRYGRRRGFVPLGL